MTRDAKQRLLDGVQFSQCLKRDMSRVNKSSVKSKLLEVSSLLVLGLVVGMALWTIARDWSELLAVGGWFAILGRFMVVFATVTLLVLLALLGIGVVIAPMLLLLLATNALGEKGYANGGLVDQLRTVINPQKLGSTLVRAANPIWKTLWWTWWYLSRRTRSPSRSD